MDASAYGHQCLQGSPLSGSEDCLLVNVFRKTNTRANAGVPVLFWIHGGGFTGGSGGAVENHEGGDYYDGRYLAGHDTNNVIVLSINYRLGAMGFKGVSDKVGGGTGRLNAINDMVVALEWARDSVAAFGGDPDQITVFGESAGALSICMLTVSPRAAGLFNQAILESGACTHESYWGVGDFEESEYPSSAELRTSLSRHLCREYVLMQYHVIVC